MHQRLQSSKASNARAQRGRQARAGGPSRHVRADRIAHWLLVAPALLFYVPLQLVPLLVGFSYSLTDWSGRGSGGGNWVGLANYAALLQDPQFWASFRITLAFVALDVPLLVLGGMAIAIALDRPGWLSRLTRSAILIPIAMSPVAIGILFTFLASPTLGIPTLFRAQSPDILADPQGALLALVIAHVWGHLGINTFIFLAGLQAIPRELYEAAEIDGADAGLRLRYVTLPLLRETTILNVTLTLIGAFKAFGLVYSMTRGGPYRATEVLSMFMYKQAFVSFQLGYGSAVAVVMVLVIVAVTAVQRRLARAGSTNYY